MKPFFFCFWFHLLSTTISKFVHIHLLKSLHLQNIMQWIRFFVRSLFLSRVQIAFIKLNDSSISAVNGGTNEPSKTMVVISLCQSEKGESIQDLSWISNKYSYWLLRMVTFSSNFWKSFSILLAFVCLILTLIVPLNFALVSKVVWH